MGESDEKFDEKEMEKREEKSPEEKWRSDPLGAVIWAIILIWAGVVFLLDNLGYLDQWVRTLRDYPGLQFLAELEIWSLIIFGAGIILLIEVLIRLIVPAYRRPVLGTTIFAMVLIGIALSDFLSWTVVFSVILILAGISILLLGFTRR